MTIHEEDCKKLKEKINRINLRRIRGKSSSDYLSVSTDLLEGLIQDHEDLQRLLKAHPKLRVEVPYA